MGKEYTLSQQYGIVGLDGMDCVHGSMAKRAALRGLAAAALLEKLLFTDETDGERDLVKLEAGLSAGLEEVRHIKKKTAKMLEKEMANLLQADGVMEIVPDLLGSDLDYETAGIDLKVYRSDNNAWLSVTESIRGEILEEGPVTLECVSLLWLFRENGCMHEIFSVREQQQIQSRMQELSLSDSLYGIIWKQEFHKGLELGAKAFLRGKRKLFQNPYLEGVNLLFPFLDRRQSIFMEQVIVGTSVEQRREAVKTTLLQKGHCVEAIKNGTETLLKIDNMYYRIWPKTITVSRVPVQGVSLMPVYR